ncbi:hypothetical protein JKP88DRAFT_217811 [Tribonema minus]|uniref:Uncharacterized protein n=1 Tax=Tribonema minus TaxID=303371 RepID=A0A835ZB19_9STRA|nr:hypothetical protein JKP88DRAFT_217811 [Tribonema minus]
MEVHSSAASYRDSPFELAPPIPPGVKVLELTTENLRAHEHAAALAHARVKAEAAERNARTASQPPPQSPPKRQADGEKAMDAEKPGRWRRQSAECAVAVGLTAAWCVQLLLSLDATAVGAASHAAWAAVYIAGAIGVAVSALLLVQSLRAAASEHQQKSASPPKLPPSPHAAAHAVPSQWRIRCAAVLHVASSSPALELSRAAAAAVCLAMHATAVAQCSGGADLTGFLDSSARAALCTAPEEGMMVPLVCIDAVLLAAGSFRAARAVAAARRPCSAAGAGKAMHR